MIRKTLASATWAKAASQPCVSLASRPANTRPLALGTRRASHRSARLGLYFVLALLCHGSAQAALSPELEAGLRDSKYVYIQSTRKDGNLSKAAEIWFLHHDGAVYVGTRPTSWRAKRIKAGRPQAQIAVGKVGGPSFKATGAIVKEPATEKLLLETFAKKYPDGWPRYEKEFRSGFEDGSRVLIKYTPQ